MYLYSYCSKFKSNVVSGSTQIITEPTTTTNQQISIDLPLIATITKHLSFTERLQMYNSDLALSLSDDDPMCGHVDEDPKCQLSQDSIIISDDEINYSLNRGVGDKGNSHHPINMNSQESIVLSDSDDQMGLSENEDEIEERHSFASIEEMPNGSDAENETINSNHSLNDGDLINISVPELCEKDIVFSAVNSSNEHPSMSNVHSQESIVLSDWENQEPRGEIEERQSFASIEMSNESDAGNETCSNHSLNDDDLINVSVRELCEKDIASSAVNSSIKCPTISNVHSQESIVLSDSEDQSPEDEIEERQSFASIDVSSENDTASEKSLDINIDDDIFNSNDSLNDEDLINLSVREMCQKEFVSGSTKASTSKSFSRTTSDMTFERKLWQPSKTPNKLNNFSDDELDEFDILVKGDRCPSPIPKENSIEISDDEFDKSFKSQPINIRGGGDGISLLASPTPTECNEFIVQSMDQIYEVRTGKLVSPKPDYENMDSPTRSLHLKKYGLKMLSKRKAVICLEHIYNRLHPLIELNERDDLDDILSQKKIASSENRMDGMDIHSGASELLVESHFDVLQESEDIFFLPSAPRAKVKTNFVMEK